MRSVVGAALGLGVAIALGVVDILAFRRSVGGGVLADQNPLVWLSTPMAELLSWISGWPLQQEGALVLYLFAIPLTLAVLGVVVGAAVGAVTAPPRSAQPKVGRGD